MHIRIIHRVRAMWGAVSRGGVLLLFGRDKMKGADRNAGNENPRFLGAKFRGKMKAYAAAVHHLPHARIVVVHLQHIIRTFRVLSDGDADVLRKPFPCNGIRDVSSYSLILPLLGITFIANFANFLPVLPRAQANTGCKQDSHSRGIVGL